jgi:hypothetical protein
VAAGSIIPLLLSELCLHNLGGIIAHVFFAQKAMLYQFLKPTLEVYFLLDKLWLCAYFLV